MTDMSCRAADFELGGIVAVWVEEVEQRLLMRMGKWSHAGIGRSVGRSLRSSRLASAPLRWPHPGFTLLEVGTSIRSPLIHSKEVE